MKLFAFGWHNNPNPWEYAPPWAIELREMLRAISTQETQLMATVDDIATDVAAEDTVIGGAVTLLQGLSAALAAAGTDPAKLATLATDITTETATLAAAVAANTPAAAPGAPPVTPAAAQAEAHAKVMAKAA